MYNEFGIKHYKGKWSCTAKTLYSKSISDRSKQCLVFVAREEQDKEKLEEYITELHKKYKHKQNRD